jgi:hypothetical protein
VAGSRWLVAAIILIQLSEDSQSSQKIVCVDEAYECINQLATPPDCFVSNTLTPVPTPIVDLAYE